MIFSIDDLSFQKYHHFNRHVGIFYMTVQKTGYVAMMRLYARYPGLALLFSMTIDSLPKTLQMRNSKQKYTVLP